MKFLVKQYTFFSLLVVLTSVAMAQPGWNWGDSIDVAKEKNALYTDLLKSGNYAGAAQALDWLLINTPDLNSSIYINGAKIFESLAEKETDPARKKELAAKALSMYDLRIKYFGDEAAVLNRKAPAAYGFYKDDKSKFKELFELFKKTIEVNGTEVFDGNLLYYMIVTHKYKRATNELSDTDVFNIYSDIMEVVDKKEEAGSPVNDKYIDTIDKLLTNTVDVDCNFIVEKLGPKFRATKDIKLATKIFALMLAQKCTDSPLALEAAEAIHGSKPDFGIAKFIAAKYQGDNQLDKAVTLYEEAASLTDDNYKKADVYLSIARIKQVQGQKSAARESAREALRNDPSLAEAYVLIGDLYMSSGDDCKGGESRVKDRAIYIAAYNMYQKAGDRERMASAKEQFPGIEEMFNESFEEGQTISTGCWIQETVKLERRPQ